MAMTTSIFNSQSPATRSLIWYPSTLEETKLPPPGDLSRPSASGHLPRDQASQQQPDHFSGNNPAPLNLPAPLSPRVLPRPHRPMIWANFGPDQLHYETPAASDAPRNELDGSPDHADELAPVPGPSMDQLFRPRPEEMQLAALHHSAIPRFPNPWPDTARPLLPAMPAAIFPHPIYRHPLVDRIFSVTPAERERHRQLWTLIPDFLAHTFPSTGRSVSSHRRDYVRHRSLRGRPHLWTGSVCHLCGLVRHPGRACWRDTLGNGHLRPCAYCGGSDHALQVCLVLHSGCNHCHHRGHIGSMCSLLSEVGWMHHFVRFAPYGLYTGTESRGPVEGMFGFGVLNNEGDLTPRLLNLVREASEHIRITVGMMSSSRSTYRMSMIQVLDPYLLLANVHVRRAQIIAQARRRDLGNDEDLED